MYTKILGELWEIVLFCVNNRHNTQMTSFLGEYEVAVDAKGRFLLPSGFRKQLAEGTGGKVCDKPWLLKIVLLYIP